MSTDVVSGNLHAFSFPVYALLDPASTLSFVTSLVDSKFECRLYDKCLLVN